MPVTHTRYLDFEKLEARGPSSATVIKLMMACNDMQLANEALAEWKKEQPPLRKGRQVGAGMYFIRIQIGHLFEGLQVIEEIKTDEGLMDLISRCDVQTRDSFEKLEAFLPKGPNRKEFEKIVGRIRNNLGFHYEESGKLIMRAIEERARRPESRLASVTRGSTAYLWHFEAADAIVDSVVVRQIWGIPTDADLRAEADKYADRVHQIFLWFTDFAGEFIWKYCEG